MPVIQQVLVDSLINHLDATVHRGRVKVNGELAYHPIDKTVKDGNILRKYIYLDTEKGYVQEAQLLSSSNEVLAIKPFSIQKEDDGLVLTFEFSIAIQEG